MISERNTQSFCCEDISLIENYDKAIADKTQFWHCHHKKGIELNKSYKELIEMGLYYNRPACELIFLTHSEHRSLHNKCRTYSQETRDKISKTEKGKKDSNETRIKKSKAVKKRWESQEERAKQSLRLKGKQKTKYLWQTPDGEIVIQSGHAKRWHPDWICLGV